MSYVMSGIGAAAADAYAASSVSSPLLPSAYVKPVQSAKPGPGAVYYPRPVVQSAKPGPDAVYSPVVRTAAPAYAPTLAVQPAPASFNWMPWAVGAVVLGGGLFLLFHDRA